MLDRSSWAIAVSETIVLQMLPSRFPNGAAQGCACAFKELSTAPVRTLIRISGSDASWRCIDLYRLCDLSDIGPDGGEIGLDVDVFQREWFGGRSSLGDADAGQAGR